MKKKSFYITTTLPYVNAEPHLGHALEFIRADIIARWKKLSGFEVFFNTGTDEHGLKVLKAASLAGKSPKSYADEFSSRFKNLLPLLGISDDVHFTRTTDIEHEKAAQEFWRRVERNGYIYKKNYKAKYCVGCEEEKTDSELVEGHCPIHPNLAIEIIEEENYFFKFSEFGKKLLKIYESEKLTIVPESRGNEMKEFIKNGLKDFSISRLKSKMSWGVPVPDDPNHVMYVWFDALPSYISALGWPDDDENFEKFWKDGAPTQYCGKDNTRFQSVMWQAMLMAADLPPTHTVVVDGFVTGEGGVKMSKSLGNAADPVALVKEYGTDALRYFVARELSTFEDSPFTMERFKESYNANLANGLGNLVSRIMKMASDNNVVTLFYSQTIPEIKDFNVKDYCDLIWNEIRKVDEKIQVEEPFRVIKTDPVVGKAMIQYYIGQLYLISKMLLSIMPETAKTIQNLIKENKMPDKPLFARKK